MSTLITPFAIGKIDDPGKIRVLIYASNHIAHIPLTAVTQSVTDAVRMPPGALQMFATSAVPEGWLACDGAAVGRTNYADLFAAIGTRYGHGDNATTFNLPDTGGDLYARPAAALSPETGAATGAVSTRAALGALPARDPRPHNAALMPQQRAEPSDGSSDLPPAGKNRAGSLAFMLCIKT